MDGPYGTVHMEWWWTPWSFHGLHHPFHIVHMHSIWNNLERVKYWFMEHQCHITSLSTHHQHQYFTLHSLVRKDSKDSLSSLWSLRTVQVESEDSPKSLRT